jgi:hypothetical protein
MLNRSFVCLPMKTAATRASVIFFGLMLIFGLFLAPSQVFAASITVTTTADTLDAAGTCAAVTLASLPGSDGQTSLREAICAANANPGADTITFSVNGTFLITGVANEDNGAAGDFDIKQSLTIQGNGVANTIIDGNGIERIFDVFPSAASVFNLSDLTLQNGDTRTTSFKEGGALYLHNNVTTTLTNCQIINNFSGANGAVENRGTLTISNCLFSDNQTIPATGSVVGGALHNAGSLAITNSTFTNNSVRGEGGAIATTTGAAVSVSIQNTTFSNNQALVTGGGLGNGGAISTTGNQGTITITNSTFSGNKADNNGGGAYFITPDGGTGAVTLTNVTLTNNTADQDNNGSGNGGGIAQSDSSITLHNTIVAGNINSISSVRDDINAAINSSSSYNLVGVNTGLTGISNGSNNNSIGTAGSPIDPLLGALANNGGTTQTHALLAGSPAINAGNSALCPSTDQRGTARVATCDIGAYEYVPDTTPPDTTITTNPANASASTNAGFSFTGSDNVTASSALTFQCQIDGAGYTACTSPRTYTGLADGSHTFQVRAVDGTGNTDPTPASYTWTIDTTAPDTTITANPNNPSTSTSASFSFSGNDGSGTGVASLQCKLDTGNYATCATPVSYTGLSEGSHTFSVRAIDAAGNVDPTPASYTWVIDITAPDTTITANPASLTTSTNASFTFSGSDGNGTGVASFECQLDGAGYAACTTPQTLTSLSEGSHTFSVRAIDEAGNVDPTPASYTWVIDTTAPDTTIDSNPTNPSASTNASFSFSGSDGNGTGVASFECQLDGAGYAACTTPQTLTGLSEGSHTFSVRAIDAAGNVDPTPASYTWVVDLSSPTVVVNSSASDPSNFAPIPITITFSEPVTGFSDTDLTIGNGTPSNFAGSGSSYSFDLVPTAQGTVTIDIAAGVANDNAGNPNIAASQWSIVYDSIAPTVTVEQAASQNDPTNLAPITFTVTFSEDVTGFNDPSSDLLISGSAGATTAIITGSARTYTVQVSGMTSAGDVLLSVPAGAASDLAGNLNAPSTSVDNQVSFDSVAPVATGIARADSNPTYAASVDFTVTFSKAVFHVDPSDFSITSTGITGASITAVSGSGTIWTVSVNTGSGNGTLRLDLLNNGSIVDSANNPLTAGFTGGQSYTVDKVAPVVSNLVVPTVVADTTSLSFTLQISDTTAVLRSSIVDGLFKVTGPNGYDQIASVVNVTPNNDGSPLSVRLNIPAPGSSWDAADDGSYSVQMLGDQLQDSLGNRSPAALVGTFTVSLKAPSYTVYLPLVSNQVDKKPDLVGTMELQPKKSQFTTGEQVDFAITIRNQGDAPAGGFWVDLMINPKAQPKGTWNDNCSLQPCYGLAWFIDEPLGPGQKISLSASTSKTGYTVWPGSFAAGTTDLYLVIDSWGPQGATSLIDERDESNNVVHIGGLEVQVKPSLVAPGATPSAQLPASPAQICLPSGCRPLPTTHR